MGARLSRSARFAIADTTVLTEASDQRGAGGEFSGAVIALVFTRADSVVRKED